MNVSVFLRDFTKKYFFFLAKERERIRQLQRETQKAKEAMDFDKLDYEGEDYEKSPAAQGKKFRESGEISGVISRKIFSFFYFSALPRQVSSSPSPMKETR